MKNPAKSLRKYVFDLLNGYIIVDGNTISVDSVRSREESETDYIELGEISVNPVSNKTCNDTWCNVELTIYTHYIDELANYEKLELICDELFEALDNVIGTTDDNLFQIVIAKLDRTTENIDITSTGRILKRTITYKYYVSQI